MRIRTTARPAAGIRRAGQRHTAEPQTWPEGTYTSEQVETMMADPDVIVEVLPPADEDEGEEPASKPAKKK